MPQFAALVTVLTLAFAVSAAEPTKEQAEFFENKVRPILVEKCYSCHSEQAKKNKGGLTLDSREAMLTGGDNGEAIVPGSPDKSKLIEAVKYKNENLQMPPKKQLPDAEVEVLSKWVAMGAPWPGSKAGSKRKPGTITDDDRKWWSFTPMKAATPPSGDEWPRNDIDKFIQAKQKAAGLTPSPEATRLVLIRRVTYDLIGLPPTPAEIDAFVNDPSPKAFETLVDRLLASPKYGQRQARHWLDLVRYADSDGYRVDDYRPNAWRYRDYVIDSFNKDKPYDRFVQEQLAGDEMFPGDPDAITATGYLRHWIYEYNNRDVRGHWVTILNDITDTTADVFMGLGLQCARCHDHKFDPLLQKDYYRLQAFFAGLRMRDDVIAATPEQRAEHAAKLKVWDDKTAKIRAEIDALEAPHRKKARDGAIKIFPEDIQVMMLKKESDRTPYEQQLYELAYRQIDYEYNRLDTKIKDAAKEKLIALKKELATHDALKPPPLPQPLSASDIGPVAPPLTIPKRGDAAIEPGYPTILDSNPATIPEVKGSTGRRTALAKWLTQPANPLVSRVFVNRIWQQHFGRGLAVNASDFGRLGEPPTHPELLDSLATQFINEGWSLKKLHRSIVLSATYRQSATHPDAAAGRLKDPENKLLWKAPVRRLEAEQIRDAIFAVTGELSEKAGGPGSAATDPRRSIYCKVMRNARDPLLDVFDAPYWFSSASSRDTTTTPVQSLLLFNSPKLLERAKTFANRLEREEPDAMKRVALAYRLAYGRAPTEKETAVAMTFIAEQPAKIDPKKAGSSQAGFITGKIPYRDGQAADVSLARPDSGFLIPAEKLPKADFTIEAYVMPRSVAETAEVRTIAAHGDNKTHGWAFGITGKKSRRKPQTVVLQLFGKKLDGTTGEDAIFSDQNIALNKPYYLAAAVKLAKDKSPGEVTFFLKDLSNDDEPLLTAKLEHHVTGGIDTNTPMTLGGRGGKANFDGLLDDVRISDMPLGVEQLLFTREGTNSHTVGYWQFEPKPGVFKDTTGHGLDIQPMAPQSKVTPANTAKAAWIDLCHVLLNASEFLYVE
ncbi:hypothetical protein BH11PLA2_BH11PLA2_33300 [soil metagenome]